LTITYEQHGLVALITMDDGKANAAGFELLDQLANACDRADADGLAIVLAGRPGLFSGGFDLEVMQGGDPDAVQRLVALGGDVALRLLRTPRPVVVACTGHAYAFGALLLLAGDTRVGEEGDLRIALPETNLGMPLPPFGVEIVRTRLRADVATALAVQSRPFLHREAAEVGILTDIANEDESIAFALERAQELANLPAGAYATNKLAFLPR